jgi:hypothetical protein
VIAAAAKMAKNKAINRSSNNHSHILSLTLKVLLVSAIQRKTMLVLMSRIKVEEEVRLKSVNHDDDDHISPNYSLHDLI